jgi:hypothetical protein
MCSVPGGNRGPANAYAHHLNSLKKDSRVEVTSILDIAHGLTREKLLEFDVFWFYVRFQPELYYLLKNNSRPDTQFWFGPNILFEKAELGPSDPWEKWFVENVESDSYFNLADFYIDRVRKYYSGSRHWHYGFFNCVNFDEQLLNSYAVNFGQRDNDILVYYKNRRIDNQLDNFFEKFIDRIQAKYSFEIVKYGSYDREEYLKDLGRSKLNIWMSIEDFCAGGQLESLFMKTPVLGTIHNNTHPLYDFLNVEATTLDSNWIAWNEEAVVDCYVDGIEKYFANIEDRNVAKDCEDFLKKFDLNAYANQVVDMFDQVRKKKS